MEEQEEHRFGVLDYIAFSSVLLVSTVTGLYHAFKGGGQKSTSEFLMASKSMHFLPIAISVLVSYLSGVSLLGIPAEVYVHGVQYYTNILCFFLVFSLTGFIFIPIYYELNITSSYEYLGKRFNKVLRSVGAIIYIIQTCFYLGVVLYAPAIALEAVTSFEVWKTVLATGFICTLYTSLGGMKAVIWTDVFQFVVIYGSLITVVTMGIINAGGISMVWQYNKEADHLNFFDFDVNPTTRLSFWNIFVGGTFTELTFWATAQVSIQRFLTARSSKDATISVLTNLPGMIISFTLLSLVGLVIFAFYGQPNFISYENTTDISQNNYTSHFVLHYQTPDQILIYFVSWEFGKIPGIQGIFVSCLFAGTLSTLSSSLNALATVTLVDIVRPIRNRGIHGYGEEREPLSSNSDYYDTLLSKIISKSLHY